MDLGSEKPLLLTNEDDNAASEKGVQKVDPFKEREKAPELVRD